MSLAQRSHLRHLFRDLPRLSTACARDEHEECQCACHDNPYADVSSDSGVIELHIVRARDGRVILSFEGREYHLSENDFLAIHRPDS